ncbi:hypothetical protein P875_00086581 [Aspergillus parasiticus SU-1]|uniref:Uncharacterized protein n=1 Tax=Aspergillus parasiticus (strain ATCC 56775 / NRRL 5862 / SRRC 143 / SU-1) TaxID=1403190 RepID=A0A0F0I3X5_ASPPU|nr:hypothetical protein P875_00086581 [Aspergillus parasiticus SU-1]
MYPSLAGWPLLLLLPGCLIDVATARLCRGSFNVTHSEDVESLFQGCTHVRGDITITDTYSGALILPNLKTIDGKLDVQYITSRPGMGNSTATQVTSLELPDTQSIKNVAIANITTLKTISMPRLESVSHFAIYQHGITTDTLDLRSLREASYFYLAGGFSSVNVDSLRSVSRFLDIYGPEVGAEREDTVEGRISKISMPKLEFLGRDHRDGGYSDDVMIRTKETPGSFSFPSLKNLTGSFSVSGPIKSLDVSSLQSSTVYMKLGTTSPLNLTLPLRKLTSITLYGTLESIKFPFLKDFESIDIHSTLPVGCKSFTTQMEEISQSLEYKARHRCSEPRSTPSLLGLIALCVIPVIAIAAAGYYCTKRKHEDMEYEEEKVVERPLLSIEEDEYEKVVGQR